MNIIGLGKDSKMAQKANVILVLYRLKELFLPILAVLLINF